MAGYFHVAGLPVGICVNACTHTRMFQSFERHTDQPLEVSMPGGASRIPLQCLHQTGLLLPSEGCLEGEGRMPMFLH